MDPDSIYHLKLLSEASHLNAPQRSYSAKELIEDFISGTPFNAAVGVHPYGGQLSTCYLLLTNFKKRLIHKIHYVGPLKYHTTLELNSLDIDQREKELRKIEGQYYLLNINEEQSLILNRFIKRIKFTPNQRIHDYKHLQKTSISISGDVKYANGQKGFSCSTFVASIIEQGLNIPLIDHKGWKERESHQLYLKNDLMESKQRWPKYRYSPEDVCAMVSLLNPNEELEDQGPIPFDLVNEVSMDISKQMNLAIAKYF